MTALPTNIVAYQPPAPPSHGPLLPTTIPEAIQVAELLSRSRVIGDHLRGSVADCFLIVNQARLWRMDPFALAQGTSFIHGKMMYEGKVVAAAIHSVGNLSKRLDYEYEGSGDNRTVTVSGTLRGEDTVRTVVVRIKDARTTNKMWASQPDQQLAYCGARAWARRHVPEVVLAVYAPEDFPEPAMRDITPPKVEPPQPPPATPAPKPAIRVKVPGQPAAEFSQEAGLEAALKAALKFMSDGVIENRRDVVGANNALLDRIAERVPELADEVSELRAAAVMAEYMSSPSSLGDQPDDPEPEPESDGFVQRFVAGDDDTFPGDLPSK